MGAGVVAAGAGAAAGGAGSGASATRSEPSPGAAGGSMEEAAGPGDSAATDAASPGGVESWTGDGGDRETGGVVLVGSGMGRALISSAAWPGRCEPIKNRCIGRSVGFSVDSAAEVDGSFTGVSSLMLFARKAGKFKPINLAGFALSGQQLTQIYWLQCSRASAASQVSFSRNCRVAAGDLRCATYRCAKRGSLSSS